MSKNDDGKFTIKEALIKNAQYFMTDKPLLRTIHSVIKKEATFDDILSYTPSKLIRKGFKEAELLKLIKFLGKFGWILQNYTYTGGYSSNCASNLVKETPKVKPVIGRAPTDEEVDKAFKDAEDWDNKLNPPVKH